MKRWVISAALSAIYLAPLPADAQTFSYYKYLHPVDRPRGPLDAQILDHGQPGFHEWVDVNGDKKPDYCRFVGADPNSFLSCQLNAGSMKLSKEPYGFNSAKGLDQGSSPAAILDMYGDGTPGYCRYVDVERRAVMPGDPPTVVKKLRCLRGSHAGYDGPEFDPSSILPKGEHVDLLRAPDGTIIRYYAGSSDDTWEANGVDAKGMPWRIDGGVHISGNGPALSTLSYVKLRQLRVDGKDLTTADLKTMKGVRVLLTSETRPDGYFDLVIQGMGGATTKAILGQRIVHYERIPVANSKSFTVEAYTSSCSGGDGKCVQGTDKEAAYQATQASEDAPVVWWSGSPPDLKSALPLTLPMMAYFAPVFALHDDYVQGLIKTGDPVLDTKRWEDLTIPEWNRVMILTSGFNEDVKGAITSIVRGAKAMVGMIGLTAGASWGGIAVEGITLPFAFYFGIITIPGYFLIEELGNSTLSSIDEQDQKYCKQNPLVEGCTKLTVKPDGSPK